MYDDIIKKRITSKNETQIIFFILLLIFLFVRHIEAVERKKYNLDSEWRNDGNLATAWITYHLEEYTEIDDICLKLANFRSRSYPLEVYADNKLIWEGETEKSLGYIHLKVKPVPTNQITLRLRGSTTDQDAFGQIIELEARTNEEKRIKRSNTLFASSKLNF